ncbi:uncharacterized protein V1516DRAFT_678046 [Lipomyces oligophaga]|uniref:uncharacterized protein n=1 Tax=Lipomyces oligophaga TaxID=45792 RepID=UPI0034CF003B
MSSDLFYSFMRITTAQVLRASGIDRCSPSALDTLTDLTIRYLDLLATKSVKLAEICGRSEIDVGDVRMAMESVPGGLRPMRILDENIDGEVVYGVDTEDEGLEKFFEWCRKVPNQIRSTAGGEDLLEVLVKKQTKISQENKLRDTILDNVVPTIIDEQQQQQPQQEAYNHETPFIIEGGPGPNGFNSF